MTSQEKKKQQNKDMDAVLPRPSWWLFWFQRVPAPSETPIRETDRDATGGVGSLDAVAFAD